MVDSMSSARGGLPRLDAPRSIVLRWWLLAVAALAVASAPTFLDIALPMTPMFAVLVLMAGFNAWIASRGSRVAAMGEHELFVHFCVDLGALGVLLYLSGGAANPMVSLLLLPVAVAALSLPGRLAAAFAALAIGVYSLLMPFHIPLAVADPARGVRLHLAGMWLSFLFSAALIAWFAVRMMASIREHERHLAEAREQALRDERVLALGALAAGAAHELGTPLATIAVLVGELERDPNLDRDLRADLGVIRQQVAVCKEIISGLTARGGAPRTEQLELRDVEVWLRQALSRWQAMRPRASVSLRLDGTGPVPRIAVDAALEQALTNLLNNAATVSAQPLEVTLSWNAERLDIGVRDRGPGFPAEVLRRGGREPVAAGHGGSGIGLMLAAAVVGRRAGRLILQNPEGGGAIARIELPLADTDREGG